METIIFTCYVLQELELDSIYGYRGFDCRNNVMYLNDGADVVYHAAGACIILNLSSGKHFVYRGLLCCIENLSCAVDIQYSIFYKWLRIMLKS